MMAFKAKGSTALADASAQAMPSPVNGSTYPAAVSQEEQPVPGERASLAGQAGGAVPLCIRRARRAAELRPRPSTSSAAAPGVLTASNQGRVERGGDVQASILHAHDADVPPCSERHENRVFAEGRGGFGEAAAGADPGTAGHMGRRFGCRGPYTLRQARRDQDRARNRPRTSSLLHQSNVSPAARILVDERERSVSRTGIRRRRPRRPDPRRALLERRRRRPRAPCAAIDRGSVDETR